MHKTFVIFLLLTSGEAFAASAPPRLAGDSLPIVPAAVRANVHGRASVIMRIAIGADGSVEKATVVRTPAPQMGTFLVDYVQKHWRFAPARDASGKAVKAEYMQPFNYDFSTAPDGNIAPVAQAEAEPAEKKSLIVRANEEQTNADALPLADMPTAGAMRGKSQQVRIDPQVLKVLTESGPAFRECGDEQATVRTSFVINESGTVARAHVRSSTLDDEDFERCVLSTLSKLVFPKPRGGEPVLVLYPVVLR